jgi:hypothetical protein
MYDIKYPVIDTNVIKADDNLEYSNANISINISIVVMINIAIAKYN